MAKHSLVQAFGEYLQPPEKMVIILMAIEATGNLCICDKQEASSILAGHDGPCLLADGVLCPAFQFFTAALLHQVSTEEYSPKCLFLETVFSLKGRNDSVV
ncbi:uncharacterized protein PRD47_004943 [Ara ararauna]